MPESILTQEYLKSSLERRNDRFYWRLKPVVSWQDKTWNTRFSGKMAGTLNPNGYRYICFTIDGKARLFSEHQLVWLWHNGHSPENQIDHISGVRDDNRIENLRSVDSAENHKNQRIPKDNTSGVMGIYWNKGIQKWYARIIVDYKKIHLGVFNDKFEAICARKAAEIRYGFHPNHGKMAA